MQDLSTNYLLHALQFAALLVSASVIAYLWRAVVYLGERVEKLEERLRE